MRGIGHVARRDVDGPSCWLRFAHNLRYVMFRCVDEH